MDVWGWPNRHFAFLCFGQGAREEGPADVERACEDAQVMPGQVQMIQMLQNGRITLNACSRRRFLTFNRNLQTRATQTLMTWRWSSWVFCAPGASPTSGKVRIKAEQQSAVYKFSHRQNMYLTNHKLSPHAVFQEFVKCSNKDIEQIIKKHMSGDVKNAFYAIGNSFWA